MIYVKVNETITPAMISGCMSDNSWDGRESKSITLELSYDVVNKLFNDGVTWSIVMDTEIEQEDGTVVTTQEEYDNSEFCIAGDITDHRDGTISVKMGKFTTEEMLLMEVLA